MTIPKSPSLKGFRPGDARRVRFVQPELVAEVEFRSWTADGLIRHSTFRGLREDKPAEKAALESEAAPASAKQGRGVIDTFLGAIFLGLTIALMHYSGMEATRFLSGSAMEEDLALLWSEKYLAFAITVTIYGACSTCLVVFSFLYGNLTGLQNLSRPRRQGAMPITGRSQMR